MTREEQINIELIVDELCTDMKTVEELQELADDLHNCVERGIQDYCYDNNIEDYEPCY